MAELKFPEWQKDFEAVVLETNEQKFAERLTAAHGAIFSRMKNMKITSDTRLEALELEGALRVLAVLKEERLKSNRPQPLSQSHDQTGAQAD